MKQFSQQTFIAEIGQVTYEKNTHFDFFILVSLLDSLQYDYVEPGNELSIDIKKLLRLLCKMDENTTLKVQRLNVATQKDNGKFVNYLRLRHF